ncbi:uncharacterized protein PgNI_06902 [Pyricularia grisea]|uniref:Mannan endo-1,6-alpha-mannosidase n=1 Tax=Pyricularia grisea TaxID=148305 RepID=A0A6P8B380_PYRGI|nr:uncharacterized protein PgNI_06902 [Pyricularia grisea]TLD09370.1 hypothetical protein PgNI_06902 [Pyricularia grisea]
MILLKKVAAACLLLQQLPGAVSISVNFNDANSVKSGASTVAFGMMKYYTGNNTGDTPGNLPDPYYWWEAGAMFGTMVDYWLLTGDTSYNAATTQALLHQVGDGKDYMPTNQTRTLGNDDQGFWAMAAMSAAESRYADPPAGQPQWLALAQAVFNEYTTRWDTKTCGGGLRWQIFQFNNGYNYKNSISNGAFFNLAARLARFTGNQTYSDWATKVWDWERSVGLMTDKYEIYDGAVADGGNDCKNPDMVQWTYNAGIYMHGAAFMYNLTESATWKERVSGLLNRTMISFVNNSVLVEPGCEFVGTCNNDQQSFKGYLTRWMGGTAQLAPFTFNTIQPILRSNAEAAAASCSGSPASGFKGTPGTACGFRYKAGSDFDGMVGVGEQMNALNALMYTLIKNNTKEVVPVTADTGGTSKGDPNAGTTKSPEVTTFQPITTAGRVAAGFLTTGTILSMIGACIFVVT